LAFSSSFRNQPKAAISTKIAPAQTSAGSPGLWSGSSDIFFASLIGTLNGLPALSTGWSIVLGCVAGRPANWAFARHVRALMDRSAFGAEV